MLGEVRPVWDRLCHFRPVKAWFGQVQTVQVMLFRLSQFSLGYIRLFQVTLG